MQMYRKVHFIVISSLKAKQHIYGEIISVQITKTYIFAMALPSKHGTNNGCK